MRDVEKLTEIVKKGRETLFFYTYTCICKIFFVIL